MESKPFHEIKSDVLVVNVFRDEAKPPEDLVGLDELNGQLRGAFEDDVFAGELFDIITFHRPKGLAAKRLVLVGSGKRSEFNFDVACQVAGTAARHVLTVSTREIAFLMRGELPTERLGQACVEGTLLGTLEMGKYKTINFANTALDTIVLLPTKPSEEDQLRKGAERGLRYATATNYTRNLVNEPSNILTPRRLADEATTLGKGVGMKVEVLGPDRMLSMGMNALLGVGKGSDEPPQLIVIRYQGADSDSPTLALIGKGLTFDAGGISLKDPDGMHYMKNDMAGAAAVLGAMKIIGELKPKLNVLGIVAAAENLPGPRSQKPGDVVKAFNGKTIEVLDTDAEGRLVLADAISYARQLGATYLLDLATLTQSCVIALGEITTGVMGNDERWVTQVLKAASNAGERMWQLPMFREYRELIESEIADVTNIANRKVVHSNVKPAGAIVGATFLREFAGDTPWVHLDIAGTAWNSRRLGYLAIGPTGVGVRTLATLALSMDANA